MNTFLLRRRALRNRKNSRGFTLIEILVVMAIIAILLSIAVPAIFGVINTANRAKDKANAVNLKTAIIAYNTDYGNLPLPTGAPNTGDVTLGITAGSNPSGSPLGGTSNLFQGLCGNTNPYNAVATAATTTGINTRNIPYLTLQKSQADANGILIQAFQYGGKVTYFGIMMDTNYDNTLSNLPDPSAGTLTLNINDSCAVWCNNDQLYSNPPNVRWSTTY